MDKTPIQTQLLRNVIIKGVLLFFLLNITIGFIPRGGQLGKVTLYNLVFPGRTRLPFGENPREAYNLSLYDLEVMFATHEINAGPKPDDEFRIVLVGDSSTWGILLEPQDTLSGLINRRNLISCDGRQVRAYNLAYPSMSLMKDLLLLEKAITYEPDLIIWPITLESFPAQNQLRTPLVANNSHITRAKIDRFGLLLEDYYDDLKEPSFWDLTLIGRRRVLFDALQLQFYGVLWAATGIDQTYPILYTPAQQDFEKDDTLFHGWSPPVLPLDRLSFEILNAGHAIADGIPILLVNEPILISEGANSDIRYNFFYPRWAYDQYRMLMKDTTWQSKWHYVDLWDVIPPSEFTNSAVHFSPQGANLYYQHLEPALVKLLCPD